MKTCSMNMFLEELNPWLSSEYLHKAVTDGKGHFTIYFLDGTKNSYAVNDCNEMQINDLMETLKKNGIHIERQ